jgi:aspartate aminotransferase
MAIEKTPPGTPQRVRRAHASIATIYEFLGKYNRWLAELGPEACDFALGNPQTLPLQGFVDALRAAAIPQNPSWFAYKMSEPSSRAVVRASLARLTGLDFPPENIFMTNGATGALLVTMTALTEAGDEVIFNKPPWFFYEGMVWNAGGTPIGVDVRPDTFDLDVDAISRAITPRTRYVIVNSPNNPTGKIYPPATLERLARVLTDASRTFGKPIYLISDEAYRQIVFDGRTFQSPVTFYKNSIMVYTYGKTLLTPGERIGYVALSPTMDDLEAVRTVMLSTQILSGWAMTSAIAQHALAEIDRLSLDITDLERRRDRFVDGLRACGYDVMRPESAFYLTPRAPIADDVAFCDMLAREGVLCLPGSVVHLRGYVRASITASDAMIERALPVFARVRERALASVQSR